MRVRRLAAVLYGSPRMTLDMDVSRRIAGAERATMLDTLRSVGFAPRIADVLAFAERSKGLE